MLVLILGIVILLGAHTFVTFRGARAGLVERFGLQTYKLIYSVVALAGFALIVWGFSRYRAEGLIPLWTPPAWGRHAAMGLMWFTFVALAAMRPGQSKIRGWLRHPMLVAVKIWALAHLLANGDLGGLVLFGSFLAWAVFDRIAVKRRGDAGAPPSPAFTQADLVTLSVGTLAYVAMIFLHPVLIGVPVIGA